MAPPRRKRKRRPARSAVVATVSTDVADAELEEETPAAAATPPRRGLGRPAPPPPSAAAAAVDPALEWHRPDYFAFSGLIGVVMFLVAVVISLTNRSIALIDYLLGLPTGQLAVFFIPACGFIAAPFAARLRHKRKLRFLEVLPFSALIALGNGLVLSLALFLHVGLTSTPATASGVPTPVPGAITAPPSASSSASSSASPSPSATGNGTSAIADLTPVGWLTITASALSGFLLVPLIFPKISTILTSGPRRRPPPTPVRRPPPRGRGR